MNGELRSLSKISNALDRELATLSEAERHRVLHWLFDWASNQLDLDEAKPVVGVVKP
jgi:hypothetical protein